jgi:hypothetical protein
MAALVKPALPSLVRARGIRSLGPSLVAQAVETDLSTPDTSIVIPTRGLALLVFQLIFANYTGVTVKAQRSLDGTNYADIASATTSTNLAIIAFVPQSPYVRLSIAGTLSAGADALDVWIYGQE